MSWSAEKIRAIVLLIAAEIAAMSLWFSAAAIGPALIDAYRLSALQAGLLTSAVSGGFVLGTLISAGLGLADRLNPKRFFCAATVFAALVNLGLLVLPASHPLAPLMRALIGFAAAGIYPVGLRLAVSWAGRGARTDTGLLMGLLVGALTLGSAAPYLIDVAGGLSWQRTLVAGSAVALIGAGLILLVPLGPNYKKAAAFHPAQALKGWTDRAMRLTNLGYLGHMWELYAMWAWIGSFLAGSFALNPGGAAAPAWAKLATFWVIGAGAVGCLAGGALADRLGRTAVTGLSLAVSGSCAAVIGFLFGASPWILVPLALLWGFAVIADSAQFSAAMSELAPPDLTGTLLTAQTCLGFLLTMATIQLVPIVQGAAGWGPAFGILAIGPALGLLAMLRLRTLPEAARLAGGRR